MSFLAGFDLLEPPCSAVIYRDLALFSSCSDDRLDFAFDLLLPRPASSPLSLLDAAADLFVSSSDAAFRRLKEKSEADRKLRLRERSETDRQLRKLSDRVAALELGLFKPAPATAVDRTYKWTTEIKGVKGEDSDRKYKLTATQKAGEKRIVKWSAEVKGKGKNAPATRTYTFQTTSAPAEKKNKEIPKKDVKKKDTSPASRIVEIEETPSPRNIIIKKAFSRRAVVQSKGKKKEISLQDAAMMIQLTFRAYMVRRSQVLRALRELAVAKSKLKEIRALFLNFSYRGRIAKDGEEKQRFTEKIIVLLLTVDSIEGPDYMVRAAKKSMTEELEVMLQVVDPQPPGKLASFRRRKFDLPEGGPISTEMSAGVTEVVEMLEEED